jgi:hypothetical protein
VVVWNIKLCRRKDMEQLLESHKEGELAALTLARPKGFQLPVASCCG